MKRKFSLLLVIAIAMSLFVGCGKNDADSKGSESDTDAIQDTEENTESVEREATVITDVFTDKKIEVCYNTSYCEKQDDNEYLLSVVVKDGEWYDIEFYETANDNKYSQQLLVEVDGGLLIAHNFNLDISNEENAKIFAEKIFVSAKMITDNETVENNDSDEVGALALTNEDKEAVYKAEYEAIKDKIVTEEKDGSKVSYFDEEGDYVSGTEYDKNGNVVE